MDWIYIFFTGCAVLGFCDSVFDENPNYNLIVIKGFIVIIVFILGMILFPQLFLEF